MGGIPLELFTMLGSALLSGVLSIWSMKMKHEAQRNEWMIRGLAARSEAIDSARRYENKGFQFTRRLIALMAVGAIIVLPKVVAAFMPDIPVLVGYTEFNPGFWFFTDGAEVIKWRVAAGLVLTPLDTHVVSAIIGLYFGPSIVRNT